MRIQIAKMIDSKTIGTSYERTFCCFNAMVDYLLGLAQHFDWKFNAGKLYFRPIKTMPYVELICIFPDGFTIYESGILFDSLTRGYNTNTKDCVKYDSKQHGFIDK